jgi:acyl-CoA reductase-like NAD-dependent aldehyde dehydrogenase
VTDALDRGARLVCGNRRERAQYWPTVLDRVPPDCELVMEETFGPCAPVTRIRDLPEAIEIVNASRFGLQAGMFTRSLELAHRAADALKVGTVIINGGPQFDSPNLPFGGVKSSGIGREGLVYSVAEMTVVKTVVL